MSKLLARLTELEAALAIDEYALDKSLAHQGDCFYRAAKNLALAISYRDAAKLELDKVEATIDLQMRASLKQRKDKVVEREVKSRVLMSKDVGEAMDRHLKLNELVNKYKALKEAFEQRGYALNKLVDLHVSGYFGDATHRSASHGMKDSKARIGREKMNEARQSIR